MKNWFQVWALLLIFALVLTAAFSLLNRSHSRRTWLQLITASADYIVVVLFGQGTTEVYKQFNI